MENFSLNHLVLYSKGWYKRYDVRGKRKNIWDDMQVILELDGYAMYEEIPNKYRIVELVLEHCQRIDKNWTKLRNFYNGVCDREVWKYGYYTNTNNFWGRKEELPTYDYQEAVLRYCISNLSNLDTQEWKPCKPNYSKLPRPNHISDKTILEHFK
jgi:hypothetical protein